VLHSENGACLLSSSVLIHPANAGLSRARSTGGTLHRARSTGGTWPSAQAAPGQQHQRHLVSSTSGTGPAGPVAPGQKHRRHCPQHRWHRARTGGAPASIERLDPAGTSLEKREGPGREKGWEERGARERGQLGADLGAGGIGGEGRVGAAEWGCGSS
jgi:hypothetical protein